MTDWLFYVGISVAVSLVTFVGAGGAVHWWFYVRRRSEADAWKLQPARFLSPRLSRHAFWLGVGNICMGAVGGGTLAWHVARGGWSTLYFDPWALGPAWLLASGVVLFFFIDAGLYYSHRLLHERTLFRAIHRWHHRYTAPTIFTTTAVHPIEFLTFQSVLVAPAFVLPVHAGVYVAVIAYTYLIGMIDHCGVVVRWKLPLHASNRFHDDHHVYFHCNYGHHTQLFDRLHGTVRRDDRYYDIDTFGGKGRARGPLAGGAPTTETTDGTVR